jgi:RES domain
LTFETVIRSGPYYRVIRVEAPVSTRLDPAFSLRNGGRWNAPGSFGALYLFADLVGARILATIRLQEQGMRPEHMKAGEGPVLCEVVVPRDGYVDLVTDSGCRAAHLPSTYPTGYIGRAGHVPCQRIGQRAYDEQHPGIACRSAMEDAWPPVEELARFDRVGTVPLTRRANDREFDDWFWGGP